LFLLRESFAVTFCRPAFAGVLAILCLFDNRRKINFLEPVVVRWSFNGDEPDSLDAQVESTLCRPHTLTRIRRLEPFVLSQQKFLFYRLTQGGLTCNWSKRKLIDLHPFLARILFFRRSITNRVARARHRANSYRFSLPSLTRQGKSGQRFYALMNVKTSYFKFEKLVSTKRRFTYALAT
jgi:hypothetical protein